jgi:hypothetical protein
MNALRRLTMPTMIPSNMSMFRNLFFILSTPINKPIPPKFRAEHNLEADEHVCATNITSRSGKGNY